MDTELWRLIASGLVDTLLADYQAVTSRDARALIEQRGAFQGKFVRTCYDTLAYVPGVEAIYSAMALIVDKGYDPKIVYGYPQPANASVTGGTTLTCDTPPDGFTTYVFEWDYTRFTELGPLAGHSQPGAGVYVLALKPANVEDFGPPSAFLTIEE